MNSPEKIFLIVWLIYTFLMLLLTIIVFIWAIKNRQFNNQEHASKLPFEIEDDCTIQNISKN